MPQAKVTNAICNSIQGLVDKQRALCNIRPDAMLAITRGAENAVTECQWQFRKERWNCSLGVNTTSLELGNNLPLGEWLAGKSSDLRRCGLQM